MPPECDFDPQRNPTKTLTTTETNAMNTHEDNTKPATTTALPLTASIDSEGESAGVLSARRPIGDTVSGLGNDNASSVEANDNAARGATPDTTAHAARPEIVRAVRRTLRLHRVAPQDLPDTVADVQTAAIAIARKRAMPGTLADWKALATTIATHMAIDRLRRTKRRSRYNAGLCEDPDAYPSPMLPWEGRDPVDTKRYIAILEELFDAGQMPEHGEEILQGEADGVSHKELATELGISTTAVDNRLSRMRAKFRAKLAMLGMLTLLLILFALMSPVGEVAAPPPQPTTTEPAPAPSGIPANDGGILPDQENRLRSSEEIVP